MQEGQRKNGSSISIHALREEGDALQTGLTNWKINFYPRPPRGGRRDLFKLGSIHAQFLSTPSARRATLCWLTV